jgi:hypothetical protein
MIDKSLKEFSENLALNRSFITGSRKEMVGQSTQNLGMEEKEEREQGYSRDGSSPL